MQYTLPLNFEQPKVIQNILVYQDYCAFET